MRTIAAARALALRVVPNTSGAFLAARMVLILLVVGLALAPVAGATSVLVRPNGAGLYSNIQAAIEGLAAGDTILLANGTFHGPGNRDIDFLGKAITIMSQSNDPGLCTLNLDGSAANPHTGFIFDSEEDAGAVVQWVKIANGYADRGGAVVCLGASPTLRGVIFSGNGGDSGGAIYIEQGSPRIENCSFIGNYVLHNGGGISVGGLFGDNSSPTIRNCTFATNTAFAGGGIHCAFAFPEITNCTFVENSGVSGGAISCYFANPTVGNCLFHANCATVGGAVWCERTSGPTFTSCTFAMNQATSHGAGVYSKDSSPTIDRSIIAWSITGEGVYSRPGPFIPHLTCCDVYANRGGDWVGPIADQRFLTGNLNADPIFCDRWNGYFTIASLSPCAPEQTGACGLIGTFGVSCTEVPVERSSWGRIKGAFR